MADLTSEEEQVLQAIAALEANGETTSLEAVAQRAALPAGATRAVLSRLLGELGLVHEVEGDELGPYYALSGRAGAERGEASAGELQLEDLAEQLGRHLGDHPFPTTTEDVLAAAATGGWPQPLVQALQGLPPGQTFPTAQDLLGAVGKRLSD